jgi:colanic acid biosynthesis glycosyl transferase WcaI
VPAVECDVSNGSTLGLREGRVPQRIIVHDYSGHPFQPQLSRRLASRGHEVAHLYSESVQIPQGTLTKVDGDASTLSFSGIRLPNVIDKQALVRRYFQERTYGRLLAQAIRKNRPDVVISSSTPLDAQADALRAAQSVGAKFVFWLQDIQGIAIEKLLGARMNGAGKLIGRYYTRMEKRLLRESDAIVSISEDYSGTLSEWGVDEDSVHVIPNWASMDELPPRGKDNPWARANGLADRFCFLYSGTIGLKHDPEVLVKLAMAYRDRPDVAVVVVSEGAKAEWLKLRKAELGLGGLRVFPFQRYADVPDVMGTADVLVAVLDADAGLYSVPSKVLAYHCARRAILLAMPVDNLAARIVTQSRSGFVVDPSDVEGFLRRAEDLRSAPALRLEMGENALRYARQTFNLDRIADRFEALFESLAISDVAEDLEDERTQAI